MQHTQLALYIDGQWIDASSRKTLDVIDPATEHVLGQLPMATSHDVACAIAAADRTFAQWRDTPALARSQVLRQTGALLRQRQEHIARIITYELGKPLAEARGEVIVAAEMFEWAAEEARRLYGRIIPSRNPDIRQMVIQEPVGPVAAFAGWNAPAITPSRKIAGALAAGCTMVIKPSEETAGVALEIARAVVDAGLPAGVLNVVFGDPGSISEQLMAAPEIKMVTFTGSTAIGKQLAALAAPSLKRLTLELGGHAPVLVFDDCDIDEAVKHITAAKFRNSGQICTSPTRIYVQDTVYETFIEKMTVAVSRIKIGNGFDSGVTMGPMANPRRHAAMKQFIDDAVDQGATIVAGGKLPEGQGWFVEPTLIRDFNNHCIAANTEPFGPMALIRPFSGFDQAISEANRLPFGLASYVFTLNSRTAKRASDLIQSGVVCINHCQASLPETPFGGLKDSGLGKEGGIEGLAQFLNIKYISQL
ncbi:NAD-dependent succinate-semialdehyde dehydrogenase [Advenella mimigardefordensis]|uniref:Succinate-semialdehyde dehydrogenase [NADP+] n=1 Tax=Advenella mimigardefordensis (strain DSM 17166 / LMG 22922 / DPN7) TaxID=1247726 RepID=W0PEE1_ADVMD|nr:NAD-dependent succinate-semialdehyde dehydrogenase [Advenella mimigardefordensis]AHG65166.1 succinate-semialdehyde dehydrogenase [NADP+] [Advenella mimigardefordensis DPN7]